VIPHVVPPVQVAVEFATVGHALEHVPQWFGSVCSLTHDPPQLVRFALHPEAQANVVPASSVGAQTGLAPMQKVRQVPHGDPLLPLMFVSQPLSGFIPQMP
jgi:hypothetical protein